MKRSRPTNSSTSLKARRRKPQTLAELRDLQRLMAGAIMRPLTDSARMRPEWKDGRATKEVAAGFIKPNDRLSSFERLEIYNRQYWFRVMECFADDFPGVRAILGEQKFRDLTVAYLANHPSRSFTLRDLGSRLIEFIQSEPRWTAPRNELALDMARLEWAHIEAFDKPAKPPITTKSIAGRNASQICLRLQPPITLLRLAYPLDNYLIRLRKHAQPHEETSNAMANASVHSTVQRPTPPARRLTYLAVHRHQNTVYYKRLQTRQFELLLALQRGDSLETALHTIARPGHVPPVGRWFQNWSALGWFW